MLSRPQEVDNRVVVVVLFWKKLTIFSLWVFTLNLAEKIITTRNPKSYNGSLGHRTEIRYLSISLRTKGLKALILYMISFSLKGRFLFIKIHEIPFSHLRLLLIRDIPVSFPLDVHLHGSSPNAAFPLSASVVQHIPVGND